MYTFDPNNKWIIVPSGTYTVYMQDVYNDACVWSSSAEGMVYDVPLFATGKFQLRPGVYTDIIFVLQNGWKLRFPPGNYTASVVGTVITDDGTARTSLPGGSNIEIAFEVSTQASLIAGSGNLTKEDVTEAVWDASIASHLSEGTAGEYVSKIRTTVEDNQALIIAK